MLNQLIMKELCEICQATLIVLSVEGHEFEFGDFSDKLTSEWLDDAAEKKESDASFVFNNLGAN